MLHPLKWAYPEYPSNTRGERSKVRGDCAGCGVPVVVTKVSQRRRWLGAAQQLRRRRAPGHVQCLLDTKQLPKWSSHSEVVEYPMLLCWWVRHQHRFKRWYVLYAFMLRLWRLNIPPPQGGNGWAFGSRPPVVLSRPIW